MYRRAQFKVVIQKVEKPLSNKADEELNWICRSLGFFEPIDKEKTAACVFREIVKSTIHEKPLGSTEISKRVKMSRGAVINHLNRLSRSGLVEKQGRYYFARSKSVVTTISELEEEIEFIMKRMRTIAKNIDKEFGLEVED